MNIGFDAKRLFCNRTGLGNYSRTLVHNLLQYAPQDHHYHLYTPSIRLDASIVAPFTAPNTPLQIHQAGKVPSAWWRSVGIRTALTQQPIQLYHGLSHEIPIGLAKRGIKTVVTIHDLIFKRHPEWHSWWDRQVYDLKWRYSCRHADLILAISEHTKADLIHYYQVPPERIRVLYQACQASYYEGKRYAFQPVQQHYGLPHRFLLFVGTLEPRKNLRLLLEAYRYLSPTQQLPLVIVGRGQRPTWYDHYPKVVHWLEDVTETITLQTLYQAAQALIYPSHYEGFGLPIVEALLSETPVIAARSSALMEAGGPHSLYVDPHTPKACAAAIERLLTQPHLAEAMRHKGLIYAQQQFDPATLTAQLLAHYQSL